MVTFSLDSNSPEGFTQHNIRQSRLLVPWNIQTTVTIRITETTIVVIKPALPKPQKLVGLAR
jgi:hypothetical protein